MKAVLLALVTLLVSSSSYADARVGNGGEFITHERNPWFIGEEPVSYCLKIDANFSLAEEEVYRLTTSALSEWSDTLNSLNPEKLPKRFGTLVGKTLSTQFRYEFCNADTELTFYFGEIDQRVQKQMISYSDYLVGFAHRDEFDPKTARGKGFVWIAPDQGPLKYRGPAWRESRFWQPEPINQTNPLKLVLLHELGHVFGLRHTDRQDVMHYKIPQGVVSTPQYFSYVDLKHYTVDNWRIANEKMCSKMTGADDIVREFMELPGSSDTESLELCLQFKNSGTLEFLNYELTIRDRVAGFEYVANGDSYYPPQSNDPMYMAPLISGAFFDGKVYLDFTFVPISGFSDETFTINNKRYRFIVRDGDAGYSRGSRFTAHLQKEGSFDNVLIWNENGAWLE